MHKILEIADNFELIFLIKLSIKQDSCIKIGPFYDILFKCIQIRFDKTDAPERINYFKNIF